MDSWKIPVGRQRPSWERASMKHVNRHIDRKADSDDPKGCLDQIRALLVCYRRRFLCRRRKVVHVKQVVHVMWVVHVMQCWLKMHGINTQEAYFSMTAKPSAKKTALPRFMKWGCRSCKSEKNKSFPNRPSLFRRWSKVNNGLLRLFEFNRCFSYHCFVDIFNGEYLTSRHARVPSS